MAPPVWNTPGVLSAFRLLGSLGLMVALGTVAGVMLGAWADRRLATGGYLTALGVFVGLAVGIGGAAALLKREGTWKQ